MEAEDANSLSPEVLLICPNLGPGGTQRVVSTLANEWNAQGRHVAVMTLVRDPEFYTIDPGVTRIFLPDVKIRDLARRLAGFFKLVLSPVAFTSLYKIAGHWALLFTRVRPVRRAIIASGSPTAVTFIGSVNIIAILATLGLDTRVIISERNDPARQRLHAPWQVLRRWLYQRADLVTANSQGALETMRQYVPAEKLVYLPNPLNPESVRPCDEVGGDNRPCFLIVARLDPQKAHDLLLNAMASLPTSLEPWRLQIVGAGPEERRLRQLGSSLGISHRLDWVGQVADPWAYYRQAEIMVLPSHYEGTPNAVIEAMHAGLSVIVSDASPGPLELVLHDQTGLVFKANDATALAAAMNRLAQNPELRLRLGAAAKDAVKQFELSRALTVWDAVVFQPNVTANG